MKTFISKKQTIIKALPLQSTQIKNEFKTICNSNDILTGKDNYLFLENNHIWVEDINGKGIGKGIKYSYPQGNFLYKPHWGIYKVFTAEEKILDVPLRSQRNNNFRANSSCSNTSFSMALQYFGAKAKPGIQLEDEIFLLAKAKNKLIGHHLQMDNLITSFFGVKNRFTVNGSPEQIINHINGGNPCIFSGRFTLSGHVVVLIGYDKTGFWVNDPWGRYSPSEKKYTSTLASQYHLPYEAIANLTYEPNNYWVHFLNDNE